MQMYSMCLDICSYKQKVQGFICWEGNHSCKLQPIFLLCQVIQIMLFPHWLTGKWKKEIIGSDSLLAS